MTWSRLQRLIALSLVVALLTAIAPLHAAPASTPATLTGVVYGTDVSTPLAGATVVVTNANGIRAASWPTGADGNFTVTAVNPGRNTIAIETKDGSFAIATPLTFAPGETRGVHLALRSNGGKASSDEEEKKKKKGAAYWTAGSLAAMSAILVGFVAGAVINGNSSNNTPTSPSTPGN